MYRSHGDTWRCYHCDVGERKGDPRFEEIRRGIEADPERRERIARMKADLDRILEE